jgi:signal transduction histidine kinase
MQNYSPRVLVAEDDRTTRAVLLATLEKCGFMADAVEDGNAAWDYLVKMEWPVVLLLDWMLPGMEGIQLCRRLLESKMNHPVHVIMLTSKHEPEEIVLALESGAHDFIAKPYDPVILKARINAGMRIVEMQESLAVYANNMEELARQRAIQLAHSDRVASLGLLSAGVAHEINNPASFIAVNLQTLEDGFSLLLRKINDPIDMKESDRLDIVVKELPQIMREIREGVLRIKDIAGGLKQFVHAERGKKTLTDIHAAIEQALKLCSARLKRTAEVKTCFDNTIPEILADTRQIEQVVVNLLMNAADAIDEKGEYGIVCVLTKNEADSFMIEVVDNGIGFSDTSLNNLFKPFYTTKGVGKGTGLGLSICKNIIEEHGGIISACRGSMEETVFRIRLPAKATLRLRENE